MFETRANLIEELIRDDQRTGFAHGNKPRLEMRQKPLLHHFSFLLSVYKPEQNGGTLVRLPLLVLVETFQVPSQVRERTGPALIHNQLVDRSLQTNVCHETACYEFRI